MIAFAGGRLQANISQHGTVKSVDRAVLPCGCMKLKYLVEQQKLQALLHLVKTAKVGSITYLSWILTA